MTTYTAIPNGDIDPESPLTSSLFTLLRDNPLAIAEGDSTAPNIMFGALSLGGVSPFFADFGDGNDSTLTVSGASSVAPGLYQHTTVDIQSGGTLSLSAPGPLIIKATTSITVTGTIDVDGDGGQGGGDGLGELPGGGPNFIGGSGGGTDDGSGTGTLPDGGDTFGAAGGKGMVDGTPGTAGATPATSMQDLVIAQWGAIFNGGASGGSSSAITSPQRGGGLVVLVAPTITFTGTITADGENGSGDNGGGGGGVVIRAAKSYGTDTGTITVTGGTAGANGKAGGNGWSRKITLPS